MRANKIKVYLKKNEISMFSRYKPTTSRASPYASFVLLPNLACFETKQSTVKAFYSSFRKLEFKNASRSSSYLVAKCIVFAPKVPGVPSEDP